MVVMSCMGSLACVAHGLLKLYLYIACMQLTSSSLSQKKKDGGVLQRKQQVWGLSMLCTTPYRGG